MPTETALKWKHFRNSATTLGVVLWLLGMLFSHRNAEGFNNPVSNYLMIFGGCVLFFSWVLWLSVWYGAFLRNSYDAGVRAAKPILTYQEIAAALEQDLGRRPSQNEIINVQQALVLQRKEDLVTAGLGVASLALLLKTDSKYGQR